MTERISNRRRLTLVGLLVLGSLGMMCCEDSKKLSRERAVEHVGFLQPLAAQDVHEVREGLPVGAPHLASLWKGEADPARDPQLAQSELERARAKVQDLRVAKSTFFALVNADGGVIRNDQEQDLMAGQNIIDAFPKLREALSNGYAETVGQWTPANGVKGKPDGQWVAAQRIEGTTGEAKGQTLGLYVTGWAWSSYARRLEAALKSHVADLEEGKQPLYYVFVIAGGEVFGTGPSPEVNAKAILDLKPLDHLDKGLFSAELEITGRAFGVAVKPTPAFGPNTAIAVLRSET